MGCGMSRFDPRHHDHGLHGHSSPTEYVRDDVDDSSDIINVTKNNTRPGSRLLFFTNHGDDDCRRSVSSSSSPIHDLKHIPQMEPLVTQGNIIGRRKCCDGAGDHNHIDRLERKSDAKLYVNEKNGGEDDEDEDDQRLSNCNLEGSGGASPLFMGSPSFREYCFVGCRNVDDDSLNSNSDIINGNRNNKEREETMRREDDIKASDEGSAGSNSSSIKKTRRVRRIRKGALPIHEHNHRAGVVRRSLMNVASCYHPPHHPHHQHVLPSPPNINCSCKSQEN